MTQYTRSSKLRDIVGTHERDRVAEYEDGTEAVVGAKKQNSFSSQVQLSTACRYRVLSFSIDDDRVYVLRVEADADAVRSIPLETERHNSIRERGPIVSGAGVDKVAIGKDAENEAKRK